MLTLFAALLMPPPDALDRVLVVVNENSPESREVGDYYVSKRHIPPSHVSRVRTTTTDEISYEDYVEQIRDPILAKLGELKKPFDYIVLTTRVPLRIDDARGPSVDGHLVVLRFPQGRTKEPLNLSNPYFGKGEPFSSTKFGMLLVTRLDGYTVADCKRLVDNALKAKKQKGLFVLDGTPTKEGQIGEANGWIRSAASALEKDGMRVQWDNAPPFVTPSAPVMGYIGWGSNDWNFKRPVWQRMKFHPGAIAETFVSTSARTFRPASGGQSLIADLIASGVTGVKGYVSEPYLSAVARPQILLDRYLHGYNLAESFYAASPVVKWKDVVVGDPLARLD